MSPGQWRRQAQVLRSLELLANGLSVTQTALEVGYEGTGALIRTFRQLVGELHGFRQAQSPHATM
jgi:AraC-like DNA-binding protein